jgi:hypothetical protein
MASPRIGVNLYAAVNNTKAISVAMETQQWVPLALLQRNKIFRSAVNNINVSKSSSKVSDILV